MDGNALQLTLREWRSTFTSPRILVGMVAVALVAGVSGPFGTAQLLGLGQRLVYWQAMVVLTYGLCRPIAMLLLRALRPRLGSPWVVAGLAGLITGTPVTLVVIAVNLVTFDGQIGADPPTLWLNCSLISLAVVVVGTLIRQAQPPVATQPAGGQALPQAEVPPPAPALLERVPHPQRGPLVALSVRDHYVEVRTERGRHLLLMRLSDAIRETSPTPGVQIHRSHWVALDAVTRVIRADGRVSVELSTGERLPISRGYLPAAREAGLVV